MKSQLYGVIGIAIGLIAFVSGLGQKSEMGFAWIVGGVFIFGCGLIAAAVGARK